MTSLILRRAARASACAVALLAFSLDVAQPSGFGLPQALAETNDAEKDAFESAKELGTVEAWDAFLSNYPKGFHADLARAYIKKLGETTPAGNAAATPKPDEFPLEAGSWGGVVRSGPGQGYNKLDSIAEGDPVSLMGVSPGLDGGYPWFKIWYGPEGSKKGYMWGGILCAKGAERPDVYKTCPAVKAKSETPRRTEARDDDEPRKAKGCGSGKVRIDGRCVERAAAASHCGPGFRYKNGTCVQGYQAPTANAPLSTEQRKAVGKGCPRGQVWNAQEGCHEDD